MIMQSSRQLKICPSTINFDRRTSIGKAAITCPRKVMSPSRANLAPRQVNAKPPTYKYKNWYLLNSQKKEIHLF